MAAGYFGILELSGVLPLQSQKLGTAQNAGFGIFSLTGIIIPDMEVPGAEETFYKTRTSSWYVRATQS